MSFQTKTKAEPEPSNEVKEAAYILLALKDEDKRRMVAAKALLDLQYGRILEGEETEIEDWETKLKPLALKFKR